MNCCKYCFKDSQIISIIESYKKIGNCDICNKKNVPVLDINDASEIKNYIQDFVDTYECIGEKSNKRKEKLSKDLLSILIDDWNIFNLNKTQLKLLLFNFFPNWEFEKKLDISKKYLIKDYFDTNFKEKNEIMRNSSWGNCVKEIKFENRFHSKQFNTEAFINILNSLSTNLIKGEVLFRGRIWETNNSFKIEEMGSPPIKYTKNGRVNSEGIQILYLADSEKTVKYEIRSHLNDRITIGKFVLLKDINIVDLTKIGEISPFFTEDIQTFTKYLALNKSNLKDIEEHISKPHKRTDNNLDYLPTQYIADLIKSQSLFDGIKFKSTLFDKGFNIAIFNPILFKCIAVNNIEINSIEYNSTNL